MEQNLKSNWMYKNLNTFLLFCFGMLVLFVISITMMFFKEIYFIGIVLTIIEIALFLFVTYISLVYKIKFNKDGFSVTKGTKVINTIKWKEIVSLELIDKFKMGKFIQVTTDDGQKFLIEYRNKTKMLFTNFCPNTELLKLTNKI